MPKKPMRVCLKPSCKELAEEGYCPEHKKERAKHKEQNTSRTWAHMYDHHWRKSRIRFLKANPLCVHCQEEGKLTPATVVDHIKPHKGDRFLFWDSSNWQQLCETHHNRKTVKEDGGFGNG